MNLEIHQAELYFDEPRLKMTVVGRLFSRVTVAAGYLVLAAAAASFILSDVQNLKWSGVFLAIFLLDALIHYGQADRPLNELPRGGRINVARSLTTESSLALIRAYEKSLVGGTNLFMEILAGVLALKQIRRIFERLDVAPDELEQKVQEILKSGRNAHPRPEELRAKTELLARKAFLLAVKEKSIAVRPEHILGALPQIGDETIDRVFNLFDVNPEDVNRAAIFTRAVKRGFGRRFSHALSGFSFEIERGLRHRVMNRAWTSRPTPTLDLYARDITDLARAGKVGFLIGHETEYGRLVETLARPANPNVLLVGEAGIGKETIIAHLASQIIKDKTPKALFDKRVVELALTPLLAGAGQDELQTRLTRISKEIVAAGNIILYIPEMHQLVKTSGNAYLSVADALLPIIMNNTFPVIGTTYPREFKQLLEPRSDFLGLFETVRMREISEEDAEKILVYHGVLLENQYGLIISFGAVRTAVNTAKKYFRQKFLPASAEELLKSTVVYAEERGLRKIGPEEVIRVAEEKVNVPIHRATAQEAKKLLELENMIHERLVDQAEAVNAVSAALREYRAGLTRKGGPIASFLFVGPTGVGKTELAKILADIHFGSEGAMVRFDMTEYQDKTSFIRFIGSPDGNVSGALTGAVLEKPYSLVLLDEFEKAYPDILNLFLQVLDDGRLTDNLGRVVDFTNTIFIATSNAHSDIINSSLRAGRSMADIAENLKNRLADVFRPELLNRFSRVIIFRDLSPEHVAVIARLNLEKLAETAGEQGIKLSFSEAAVKKVAELGYDSAMGARPLRRAIDDNIKSPLAEKILAGDVKRGNTIRVEVVQNEFAFQKQRAE